MSSAVLARSDLLGTRARISRRRRMRKRHRAARNVQQNGKGQQQAMKATAVEHVFLVDWPSIIQVAMRGHTQCPRSGQCNRYLYIGKSPKESHEIDGPHG
jgi:hypothetical protein